MSSQFREIADLVIRWFHLIAGIMWIGNSMLFNWLDRNLEKEGDDAEKGPEFEGRIWMVHSGGFYDVVKKQLEPKALPKHLHWFMYQNLTTWVSGVFLLCVVYYFGKGYLVDPSVSKISHLAAVHIGLASIASAWVVYDVLFRLVGKQRVLVAVIGLSLLAAYAYGMTRIFSGRAAYIHVGVAIGTIMTGNVWMVIIPSQRELVNATKEGRAQDPRFGKRAKERSIHNNYLTFPLLFIMISNHFPSTYGNALNWLVLGVLMFGGALIRHFMNIRFHSNGWSTYLGMTVIVTMMALFILTKPKEAPSNAGGAKVSFHEVQSIVSRRCAVCHSEHPTDDTWKVAPAGVKYDTPEQIKVMAPRMRERAVVVKTMPLANKTGMTDEERATLGAWVDQGASIE